MYIVYLTICLPTGQIYIGKHNQWNGTNPFDFDGYLGSGVELQALINEHGPKNFIRTTASVHSTEEEAFKAEKALILKMSLSTNLALVNRSTGSWSGSHRQTSSSRAKLEKQIKQLTRDHRDLIAKIEWAKQKGWDETITQLETELRDNRLIHGYLTGQISETEGTQCPL